MKQLRDALHSAVLMLEAHYDPQDAVLCYFRAVIAESAYNAPNNDFTGGPTGGQKAEISSTTYLADYIEEKRKNGGSV